MKAVKLYLGNENMKPEKILNVFFGERKETIEAAKILISRMKANRHLALTKREMRFLAKELESGKLGIKYSYHNFYTKMLKKLIELGFIDKDVLIWDEERKKTKAVYQIKLQLIPERPPQGGFVKKAWLIAKSWNEFIQD